jgi:hypothetical protein
MTSQDAKRRAAAYRPPQFGEIAGSSSKRRALPNAEYNYTAKVLAIPNQFGGAGRRCA